jgi:UrcA family protein
MTFSTLKFEFAVAIVLAATSASAVAQEKQQSSGVTIQAGEVQETAVGRSYIDIEELKVKRTVSYANLDLTTAAGAAELRKRVMEAAKDTCDQVAAAADPIDVPGTSDYSCIRRVTERGLERANVAVAAAQFDGAMRATDLTSK